MTTPTPSALEQTKLKHFTVNEVINIPQQGSWQSTPHLLDKESAYALEMALATGRPLLVQGEPGVGKSQLARAAAEALGRLFISEVVNINTEGQDLLWRFDPVARLNDAQALSQTTLGRVGLKRKKLREIHPKNYINPGILWWTFDWQTAATQYQHCKHKLFCPQVHDGRSHKDGVVLLLDEIDKADPSLPNSLLEVLGNGGFQVPMLNCTVGLQQDQIKQPLIIITTNDERELPPAFLRRCLVLNLKIDEKDLKNWLLQRAEVHFKGKFSDEVKQQAATFLETDRIDAARQGMVKPGQAEYLDLLKALDELTGATHAADEQKQAEQLEWLDNIRNFALVKDAGR